MEANASVFGHQLSSPVNHGLCKSSPTIDDNLTKSLPAIDRNKQQLFIVNVGMWNDVPNWFVSFIVDLNRIAALPVNWDSYGALAVTRETLEAAIRALSPIVSLKLPQPYVAPTVRGGIEFKWHKDGVDLEIQTESTGINVYLHNGSGPEDQREREFEDLAIEDLADVLKKIVPSVIAKLRPDMLEHGRSEERR